MDFLVAELTRLKRNYGVVGIKKSFEDEGATRRSVDEAKRLSHRSDVDLYVKIGGCEAISDILYCHQIGVNYVIAPMVETGYAFSKFTNAISRVGGLSKMGAYFLCETQTAYENLELILTKDSARLVNGVVLGRSDFTKSYGMSKEEVDSEFIKRKVLDIFGHAKSLGLKTTLGGNISESSCSFLSELASLNLIDKFETRNTVISIKDIRRGSISESINESLKFEIMCLENRLKRHRVEGDECNDRIDVLRSRIK